MTEREPDNLYDALRDRLADYGQEPPAPLWANIRAQLPPPVATPQLRRRARRRWLAALALLLLVGSSTWQWWRPAGLGTASPPPLATRAAGSHSDSAQPTRPSASLPAAPEPSRPAMAPGATARQTTAEKQARSASTAAAAAPSAAAGALPATAAQAGGGAVAGSWPTATTPIPSARLTPARSVVVAGSRATRAAAPVGKPNPGSVATLASRSSAAEALAAGSLSDAPIGGSPGSVKLPASTEGETAAARANAARTASRPALTAAATMPPTAIADAQPTAAETTAAQATVAAARQQRPKTTPELQAERENWQPAARRPAALLLQPSLLPTLLARADSLPPLPVVAVRRWAVQALAGPAITSRQLGARPPATLPVPSSTFVPRSVTSNGSVENEQATAGFGAEVQLQRLLTGRWSLGTGLGYQAFATSQTVNLHVVYGLPVASIIRPDSTGTLTVRNTYHFLTLPLRVGYQLGTGRARLRYGLRAGADVAFYLGGRSTEGSTSGTVSRNWGASGSPYRPFSLALSLGAEVRYRLAPGWELLAQPTLTHFVTSVARPVSGYVPRYPVAATALVGVAYWLH